MTYKGKLTRNADCAICKKVMPEGEIVYFDSTKRQGSHLVHTVCWDNLRATRQREPITGERKPVLSSEPLDAPF